MTSSCVRVLALGSGRPVGGEAKKSTAAQHCVSNKGGFLCQPSGSSSDTHMHLLKTWRRRWVKDLEPDQASIAPGEAAGEYASFSVIST